MLAGTVRVGRNRHVQRVILAVAVSLNIVAGYRARDAVGEAVSSVGPLWLGVSLGLFVAGVLSAGVAWHSALEGLGEQVRVQDTLKVFSAGQVGKYLPGSVWVALMFMEFGRRFELRRAPVGLAVLAATSLGLVCGLVLGLPVLPTARGASDAVPWQYALLGLPLLTLALPRVLNRLLSKVASVFRSEASVLELSGRTIAAILAWSLVTYILQGLHLVVIAWKVSGAPINVFFMISAFALAWSVGLLFLPAPAGVGVREVALVGLLSTQTGATTALAIAVVSRSVTVVADLGLTGIALLAMRREDTVAPALTRT